MGSVLILLLLLPLVIDVDASHFFIFFVCFIALRRDDFLVGVSANDAAEADDDEEDSSDIIGSSVSGTCCLL